MSNQIKVSYMGKLYTLHIEEHQAQQKHFDELWDRYLRGLRERLDLKELTTKGLREYIEREHGKLKPENLHEE